MNTSLYEFHSTIYWNILRESVPGFVKALNENIISHRVFSHSGMPGVFLSRSRNFEPSDATYVTEDPECDIENPWCAYISDDDEFINLVRVDGGITRNNACSFGSRAQRDQVLYAAKRPNCIGHIFLINTPGGSAYSVEDYTEAIDAAHAAGQRVIACIDGLCCSAGYALACQCDEIYYTSPSNMVGCIGTMAIFSTLKDGDTNTITQEKYREIYDPESFDKNIETRKCADGDDSLILEELAEHGRAFRELVMRCRPQVKEEQIHGLTYKASEVEGTLVDGRLSLQGCIDLLANKQVFAPATEPKEPEIEEPAEKCKPKKECHNTNPSAQSVSSESKNNDTMLENLQTALIEAQSSFAEAQAQLEAKSQEIADLNAQIAERDATIANAETAQAEAIASATAEHEATIADLNSQVESLNSQLSTLNATVAERDAQVESLNSELSTLNATVAEHVATIAERDTALATANERIASLEASLAEAENTISELAHQPSATATPSPATAGEGEGDEGKKAPESACASQPGMTIAERRAAQKARDKQLGI